MHYVSFICKDLNICIMFLLFAKLGRNSNTVQSKLSPIVQWMEFGPSPVTVLLNQNHFQYCVLPYIFFNIIVYCIINFIWCLIVILIWADNSKIKVLVLVLVLVLVQAYHHWCCEFGSRSGRGVQHYVIKFVSDLRQVGGFLPLFQFPPPIKLTATI
jgi:hypothetical protein